MDAVAVRLAAANENSHPIVKAREDANAGKRDEELYANDSEYHDAYDAEADYIAALGLAERKRTIKRLIRKNIKN